MKKRTGQKIMLTPQTMMVVKSDAYLARKSDSMSMQRMAMIIKSNGAEEMSGIRAMKRVISARAEAIAPNRQTKLRMRVSNGNVFGMRRLVMSCLSFFIIPL